MSSEPLVHIGTDRSSIGAGAGRSLTGPNGTRHAVPAGHDTALCGHRPARIFTDLVWPGPLDDSDDICAACRRLA
jgi:hypothetical protein